MSYTGTCANRFYWNCVYCCRNFRPLKRDLIKLLVEATKAGDEKELEYFFVRAQIECSKSDTMFEITDVLNSLGDDGFGCLHWCCKNDDLPMLLRLFAFPGIDLDLPDHRGFTPLHICCQMGHSACTNMLLNYGASANLTDRKKNSPLILAASAGYSGSCRALLDHGANSSYRNILGLSALLASIMHQKTSTALLLIKLGADMSIVDAQGNSPLHYACEANTSDVAKFLMENGHKVRVYNKYNGKFQLCNSIFKIKYYI